MHLKFALYIFNVLMVHGFEVLNINDGYRGLMKQIESIDYRPSADVIQQWIEQDLDHFNAIDTRTWKMRYYENLNLWKKDGPVYLYISGEAPAAPVFLSTGVLYELAKETNGALYLSEHRYYGRSQPVNRTRFNVEDMKFLKATQALADNTKLLRMIKNNTLYKNSKVVVMGGSYAGNLAAWMKLVYPDLVDAAIASSGPVEAKADFYEYFEVVGNDYRKYGTPGCLDVIKSKFQKYDKLFQSEDGIKQLKKEENICEKTDMSKSENKQLFFLAKTTDFIQNTQYGTVHAIKSHCQELNVTEDTTVLLENEKYYFNNELSCYEYDFDKMLSEYRDPQRDDSFCWTYQTCTEFGYFQTASTDNQPFTKNIPVDWYFKFCTGLFGVGFDGDRVKKGVKETNERFGARTPNITEVVFVNGELDPWSSLGIVKNFTQNDRVFYIPRSSHCRDMFSNDPGDDEELVKARAHIKDQIKKWITVTDKASPDS